MTQEAATLVLSLTDRGPIAPGSGVRIVVNPQTDSLSMSVAGCAEDNDSVVVRGSALVFLSQPAARRMVNQTLCAEINPGRSSFFLRPGPGA